MKYIRTKDGIYERMFPDVEQRISFDHKTIEPAYYTTKCEWVAKKDVLKQADTIEELCDEFVRYVAAENYHNIMRNYDIDNLSCIKERLQKTNDNFYGAIWTDKGLIYVAKMNKEGRFELL